MPYGELVSRSFAIAWRNRYLWLLAFLAGVGGSGGYRYTTNATATTPADQASSAGSWIVAHAWLLAGVAGGFVLVALVFFLVGCAALPALIRSSAELDAERPWSHRLAWRAGLESFWPVLGLRLLAFLYFLAWVAVFAGFFALAVYSVIQRQAAGVAISIVGGLALAVVAIGLTIWLSIGYELGMRSVVLGGLGPLRGLRHGLWLLSQRPGRVLLVWLLSAGLGWAAGVVLTVVAGIVEVAPAAAALQSFRDGNWSAFFAAGGIVAGLGIVLAIVPGGLAGAFLSTYWTLAFRRMEWP